MRMIMNAGIAKAALSACVCLAVLTAAAEEGKQFILAENGKPAASIVISASPTRSALVAALELRDHVKKISGAELPVLSDQASPQGAKILVGESAATRALGLRGADFKTQEYMVGVRGGDLVLMGRDEPKPSGLKVNGAPKWVEGKFGKALSFDGAQDRLLVSEPGFDDAQGSMEAWARPAAGLKTGVLLRLDGSPWSYHIVSYEEGRLVYTVYNGKPNGGSMVKSEKLTPGWHHFLAAWDAAKGRSELFVDGKSVGSGIYSPTHCAKAPLQIAAMDCGGKQDAYFKGEMDEIRVSNVARTPAGFADASPAIDASTLALLRFDEGAGTPNLSMGDFGRMAISLDSLPAFFDEERGSCHAVYDFLERDCGVRWYAPTDLGMVCDPRPTLAAEVKELRRAPAIACRYSRLEESVGPGRSSGTPGPFRVLNNPSQLDACLWQMRMKFGGKQTVANHGLYSYFDRFWEKNPNNPSVFEGEQPEYFAKGYKGRPQQLCLTNPALVAQVVKDAQAFFTTGKSPGIMAWGDWVSVEPMDNDDFCRCPECMKWYKKGDQPGMRAPTDVFASDRYSNYVFQFANAVQQGVSKTCPDGHVFVLAYASHGIPPDFPVDPKIHVGPCLGSRQWLSPGDPKAFAAWVEREAKNPNSELGCYKSWVAEKRRSGRLISMWLYLGFPLGMGDMMGFHAFLGYHAHTLANQLRMFAADGVNGIFTCGIGEQLDTYVTLKYLDNPGQDVDVLLDEFFARYYGAAGAPLQRVYTMIEETYGNLANYPASFKIPSHQTEEIAWKHLGTEERMGQMAKWMEEARAAKVSDAERQRVALFDQGPWQYMVEGRRTWLAKSKYASEVEALQKAEPPATQAPAIPDAAGDLAKVDWAKAGRFAVTRTHEGYPAERQIGVEIAHDAKWLYLRLSDPVARGKVKLEGAHFWDDRWEIFLATQRGAADYRQFGIKPDGRFMCLTYPGCKEFDSGAQVKCQVDDKGWVTELAVPLSLVWSAPQQPGDQLCLNLYRPASAGQTTLAWSPNFVGNGFNTTARLGSVTLGK